MTGFEWKCSHCSFTNEVDMSRDVFGDTDEGGQTCVMHCNICIPPSDEVVLAKK
jgi:hypothetical protein